MIRTDQLTRQFSMAAQTIVPVRAVTVEIPAGQVVFVVGPSGSGKSTLLNLMGALDQPTSGSVVVDGRDLATLSNHQAAIFRRTTVGFVFQANNLLAPLTALGNVAMPLLPDGSRAEAHRLATEALTLMGLGDRLANRPAQLSGGEAQRVAVARALVRRPKLLLADEPTGALDTETGSGVMEALRGVVTERQMTAVIVTHTREWIRDGDRVLEMRDGVLREMAAAG